MLLEVTARAREAESTKNEVLLAKDRAQRLVDVIAADKGVAEMKLEAARPALEEAEAALNTIKPAHIGSILFRIAFFFLSAIPPGSCQDSQLSASTWITWMNVDWIHPIIAEWIAIHNSFKSLSCD